MNVLSKDSCSVCSPMVRIIAFQAIDPSSILDKKHISNRRFGLGRRPTTVERLEHFLAEGPYSFHILSGCRFNRAQDGSQ